MLNRRILFTLLSAVLLVTSACQQDQATSEAESVSATEAPASETSEKPVDPIASVAAPEAEATPESEFVYVNPLSKEQKADGWISLFDGQSLFGWESTDDNVNWSVNEGAITADSGPIGFLMTTVPFADYELVCEYRSTAETNSGLFLRSEFPPGDITTECYEINIARTHPDGYTSGSLVNRKKLDSMTTENDDWNELRTIVSGNNIEIALNGTDVLKYSADNNVSPAGRIGLQKNSGKIEFRKIILKPLNLKSMFNGKDLAGWREVPGSKSEFKVENGEIHVTNGQGFIETEETYQNFLFQAQAISHAPELNSGFFFRAIAGTEKAPSNGYEYQIHNGYDGDRSQPNNAGTGAIFRRVDARYVVANDEEWFTSTLIAHGPRISCWVDGYQVVDWIDERKPDDNPRRGQRLAGGHISIQGHDPTTDLSFKNLKIVEYPKTTKSPNAAAKKD